MNEKLTTKQRDWILDKLKEVSLELQDGNVSWTTVNIHRFEQILTAHTTEDEDMCQCFTCQGSGKWASGFCPDSENPAHTTEDECDWRDEKPKYTIRLYSNGRWQMEGK